MNHKHIVSVIGVVVLVSLITTTMGCVVDEERKVADMMRKIPENSTMFIFNDAKTLRSDADLKVHYDLWKEPRESMFEEYGIHFNNVD